MKDYLHLFGGMIVAILLLAAYIFFWGCIESCYGMEVKRVAPDGVNTITLEVDDNGYVMGEKSTAVYVAPKYIPQSGDEVVVNDVTFVLIASADWERWTNAVARLESVAERRWAKEHSTAEGRRAWHGTPKREVAEDGRSVTWRYPDGYTYVEEVKPAPRRSPAVSRQTAPEQPRSAPKPRADKGLPPRLRAKQEAVSARPASKEVNATFGPGGKLLNVEGEK